MFAQLGNEYIQELVCLPNEGNSTVSVNIINRVRSLQCVPTNYKMIESDNTCHFLPSQNTPVRLYHLFKKSI